MQGQALYCQGSALQSQGRLDKAIALYQQAACQWEDQPVVWLALVNAQSAAGRPEEAAAALAAAEALEARLRAEGRPQQGLRIALKQLRAQLEGGNSSSGSGQG